MATRTIWRMLTSAIVASMLGTSISSAQIVINEIVKEERTAVSGSIDPDVREFVELYNAGDSEVDLTSWSVEVFDLATGAYTITDTIPGGTIAPGDYFVLGGPAVPNVDYLPPVDNDLYDDGTANIIELRTPGNELVDAIGYELFRIGTDLASPEQIAEIGNGFQGQVLSMNANAPNERISWARYRDGLDTNRNGLDFGFLPLTPGESNNILPQNEVHSVPDTDALSPGTALSDDYYASFVLPRVIDPTVASGINPREIPPSPQEGNAIVAWDESGGGNTALSKELVNSFDLYAYFDTTPLGVAAETEIEEWESSAYGIGTSDPFFGNPDPTGGIFVEGTVTQNGSTGIGWVYQQYETPDDPGTPEVDEYDQFSRLALVDFGMGGNSTPEAEDWTVIETIDMSTVDAGWYRLAVDYDPATGDVVARFDDDTYMFNTSTDLSATFFVGYREAITDQGQRFDALNPPIYDLYVESPGGVPGDFDGDGTVGIEDYQLWKTSFGDSVEPGTGADGNGDGIVNAADYVIWRNLAQDGASSAGAPVPEPAGLLLLAFVGLTAGCAGRVR